MKISTKKIKQVVVAIVFDEEDIKMFEGLGVNLRELFKDGVTYEITTDDGEIREYSLTEKSYEG